MPSPRTRAYSRPRRQLPELPWWRGNQHIASILSSQNRDENQARRKLSGEVFGTVNGEIDRARKERFVQFLREHAASAENSERGCSIAITRRHDGDDRH